MGVFRYDAKGPRRRGKQTPTAKHAGIERGATETAKTVFLVSRLICPRFCGCCCNYSKKVPRRARKSALARRFKRNGEREEKKILKCVNGEGVTPHEIPSNIDDRKDYN